MNNLALIFLHSCLLVLCQSSCFNNVSALCRFTAVIVSRRLTLFGNILYNYFKYVSSNSIYIGIIILFFIYFLSIFLIIFHVLLFAFVLAAFMLHLLLFVLAPFISYSLLLLSTLCPGNWRPQKSLSHQTSSQFMPHSNDKYCLLY